MTLFSFPIPKIRRRQAKFPKPGSIPGTLVVEAEQSKPVLRRFVYGPDSCESAEVRLDDLDKALESVMGSIVWLDVQGLGDGDLIKRIGKKLGLHPLSVEDIVHIHQRPKAEEFEDYLFVVIRAIRLLDASSVDNEQLSYVLKDGLLVTFQERIGDGFNPVRQRLRDGKGQLRKRGADYLMYTLMDIAIDNYFPVLERYGEIMEQLDDQLRENPQPELSRAVHSMRRELRQFRRAVWPLRDVVGELSRNDFSLIDEATRLVLRDCYDHILHVAEFLEGSRERASELADLYMIMVSEKTNQVMKVLTIIATIFIPLTFLCGIYGMNFDPDVSPFNMPEVKWRYGYLAFWATSIVMFLVMIWFFRHKGWIGKSK